jgi:hypothetical protein
MLFFVRSSHDPSDCPLAAGGGPEELIDASVKDVKVHAAVADMTGHTVYFILETDRVEAIKDYLLPGLGKATAEITPVADILTP